MITREGHNKRTKTSWPQFRELAFKRDKYSCVKCGYHAKDNNTSELVADHIEPIALGGEEWNLDNVQTLCKKCDKDKTHWDLSAIHLQRKFYDIFKKPGNLAKAW